MLKEKNSIMPLNKTLRKCGGALSGSAERIDTKSFQSGEKPPIAK